MKLFLILVGIVVVLQASLLEASRNAGPQSSRTSNRNGNGRNGSGGGGGGWGTTGDRSYRHRREIDETVDETETRQKRSFAPGAPSFPAPKQGGSNNGERGTWGVSANRDKGRGPQIRTEAQGNIYSNGRVRVDGQGHHEFGKGRKPSYGGSISGRWRRALNETEQSDQLFREKRQFNFMPSPQQPQIPRFPQPTPGDRGSIGVSINHGKGTGPQIRTDAQGNIFTSRNGNWRVDGNGYHEAGRGRKPDYGVGVKVQGRFRRDAEDEETAVEDVEQELIDIREKRAASPGDRGSVSVSVNKDQGRGPQFRTDAKGNIFTSRNGNWRVDGTGFHEAGRGRKPDYGAGIQVQGRFRRDADEEAEYEEEEDNLEIAEREKRSPGSGAPKITKTVYIRPLKPKQTLIRKVRDVDDEIEEDEEIDSRDKRSINTFGKPIRTLPIRPQPPILINRPVHPRPWTRHVREIETEDVEEEAEEEETREKRQARPGDRGSVSVSVNKDKGRGPQFRTDAQYNIYKKNNWEINSHGYHEAGRGRKPDYGGGISITKRF